MSEATHILRHAAGSTRLHTISMFTRLAVLEDQRRRDAFVRAKPTIPLELAEALGAFRSICRFEGVAQYESDMRALSERRLYEISGWLTDSGFSDEADERWFNTAEETFSLYRTEDDQFTTQAFYCEYETCHYSDRINRCTVVVAHDSGGWRTETWSEPTTDIEAFYCEASDRWYSKADFTSGDTSDGRTICTQWARLNGWWEDDDGYWRSADDDGDDDDDDDTNNLIPSYHDASRNWSLERARQAPMAYYGLEVELEFQDQDDCERYYEDVGFPTEDLTAERDGSLDDECGLEVISRPFTLVDLRDRHNPLRQALDEACNWNACEPSPSGYGVHVTTNAQRLAWDHRRRLIDATYDMGQLTAFVAGRKPNSDHYNYRKELHYTDTKYTAIHERPDGAYEFRVFQGTPDWETVLSYIEYVDALTEWTRNPANPTVGPVGQALFRAWVCVTGDYPALATRFTTTQTREAVACALPLLSRAA